MMLLWVSTKRGNKEPHKPSPAMQNKSLACQTAYPLVGRKLRHLQSKQKKCLTGRDNTEDCVLDSSGCQTTTTYDLYFLSLPPTDS